MKHEPRQAIHVEKQLGWACKLGGMESQGPPGQDNVIAWLMGSQI